jgi:hypothetical protein
VPLLLLSLPSLLVLSCHGCLWHCVWQAPREGEEEDARRVRVRVSTHLLLSRHTDRARRRRQTSQTKPLHTVKAFLCMFPGPSYFPSSPWRRAVLGLLPHVCARSGLPCEARLPAVVLVNVDTTRPSLPPPLAK